MDFIVERLVASKETIFTADLKKHMDLLITQLITFSEPHPLVLQQPATPTFYSILAWSLYKIGGGFPVEDNYPITIN